MPLINLPVTQGTSPFPPRFHAPTWYADQVPSPGDEARPEGSIETGTLVIGAGLAGLSVALGLIERGDRDVSIVERGGIGEGASGRNGGFVFAGYSLDNDRLFESVGAEPARRLHGWTRGAVDKIARRCRALDVATSRGGVVLTDWFGRPERLQAWRRRMAERLGFELDWLDPGALAGCVRSPRYDHGLLEPGSFHFNPLAYALALGARIRAAGGRIFENCPAVNLRRAAGTWRVEVPGALIRARRVVLATGGYDRHTAPRWQRSVQPVGTYVMVTEPLGARLRDILPGDVAVYDNRFAFDYYRPLCDSRLLWGGRISMADRDPRALRRLLGRDLARVFPTLAGVGIDYAWGGWMSYARHQMPVLGEVEPGLWLALAFGGHGMATTTLAGEVLAEALAGDRTRLAEFARWGPVWAGGPAGRAAVQGVYWYKQLRDRLGSLKRNALRG